MVTLRIRSIVWFATGVALTLALTLLITQAWKVDAAIDASESTFVPVEPCRLFDTRPGNPPNSGSKVALASGESNIRVQQVTGDVGNCLGVPAGATAVSMNVTIVNPTAQSNLRIFPAGVATPTASNLNWLPRQSPTPNKVDVKLSSDGKIELFNYAGSVDVLADVVGYYTNSTLQLLDQRLTASESRLRLLETDSAPIPSGATVIGYRRWDHSITADDEDVAFDVQLPGRAPIPLTDNTVNFAPSVAASDDDPQCAGTLDAPTAPAGKVCIYVNTPVNIRSLSGFATSATSPLDQTAFTILFREDGFVGDDMYVHLSWAYTAP